MVKASSNNVFWELCVLVGGVREVQVTSEKRGFHQYRFRMEDSYRLLGTWVFEHHWAPVREQSHWIPAPCCISVNDSLLTASITDCKMRLAYSLCEY